MDEKKIKNLYMYLRIIQTYTDRIRKQARRMLLSKISLSQSIEIIGFITVLTRIT